MDRWQDLVRSLWGGLLLLLGWLTTVGCQNAATNRSVTSFPGAVRVLPLGPEPEQAAAVLEEPVEDESQDTDREVSQDRTPSRRFVNRVMRVRNEPPRKLERLARAVQAAREAIEQPAPSSSTAQRTQLGKGMSLWFEMVRPAEEIVHEQTPLDYHELVSDPTLLSLAWAVDLDPQTAFFLSVYTSRQLDEALTDSMFDPDFAWFGLGIQFRF